MPEAGRALPKLRGRGGEPARGLLDTVMLPTGACGQASLPAGEGQEWGREEAETQEVGNIFKKREGNRAEAKVG